MNRKGLTGKSMGILSEDGGDALTHVGRTRPTAGINRKSKGVRAAGLPLQSSWDGPARAPQAPQFTSILVGKAP